MNDEFATRVAAWMRELARADPVALASVRDSIDTLPARRGVHRRGWWLSAAAGVAIVALGASALLVALRPGDSAPGGLTLQPSSTPSTSSPSASSPASTPIASVTPVASVSPTIGSAPGWASDLGGQLECDGPAPGIGGEVGDLGGWEPGPTPDAALQSFLDLRIFASFPAGGFEPALVEGQWARHEYRVDGRIRALAVSSVFAEGFPEGDGWHVVGIRACDPSEFDPADGLTFDQTLWLDAAGKVARSETIHSSPGPGHCGWQSAILLRFEGVQYVRDPDGVLAHRTVVAFDADIARPDDAVDTGLHTGDWRLHTVPAGDAVYVVTGDGSVERWGRARDLIACA